MGTVYRGHDKKRTQSTGQNHGTGDSSETDRQKTRVSMEVCEQDPEHEYHGATVMRFAKEIAEKEFQPVIREKRGLQGKT